MKTILLFFALLFGMFAFQIVHYLEFSDQMARFANKGPRFTANDGQVLCERVRLLEKEPQPCEFVK
jgi:hypothetical protein